MWHSLVFAAVTSLLWRGSSATGPGAVKLDNYTFAKFTSIPGQSVLVKFDRSYAYGEKEDEFKLLCKSVHKVPSFFVAEVPIQEYGDKENDGLREQFGLTKEDFPVYYLFDQKHKDGLKYTGDIKAGQISAWVRRKGIPVPAIDTIDVLDEIVRKFLKEGLPSADIDAARRLAEGEYSEDRKANMYVKIMQKVKEKGVEYIEGEIARVTKILEGKLAPEKVEEMQDKMKVLDIFASRDEL